MLHLTNSRMTPAVFLGLGVISGFGVHYSLFIHGEWHAQAPYILLSHVGIFLCIPLAKYFMDSSDFITSLEAIFIFCGYVLGLMASIAIYRIFFHRLTKAGFPGPPLARVTKLWHVWVCRASRNHQVLYSLNKQYGDFVRTGRLETKTFLQDTSDRKQY